MLVKNTIGETSCNEIQSPFSKKFNPSVRLKSVRKMQQTLRLNGTRQNSFLASLSLAPFRDLLAYEGNATNRWGKY